MKDIIKLPKIITKTVLKNEADKIIDIVNEGEADAMDVYLQLKVYEEIIKTVKAGIIINHMLRNANNISHLQRS